MWSLGGGGVERVYKTLCARGYIIKAHTLLLFLSTQLSSTHQEFHEEKRIRESDGCAIRWNVDPQTKLRHLAKFYNTGLALTQNSWVCACVFARVHVCGCLCDIFFQAFSSLRRFSEENKQFRNRLIMWFHLKPTGSHSFHLKRLLSIKWQCQYRYMFSWQRRILGIFISSIFVIIWVSNLKNGN